MVTPNTMKLEHLVAIVDTREQRPLNLSPIRGKWGTLYTGDYSIEGLESVVSVERKSFPDFLGCVGCHRARFDREVQRLRGIEHSAIVIEGTWADVYAGGWRNKLNVNQVVAAIVAWSRFVPVHLTGTRAQTERFVRDYLFQVTKMRLKEDWPTLRRLARQGLLNVPAKV